MEKFGLIGYPLGHSMSAIIHKAGFDSLGIKEIITYCNNITLGIKYISTTWKNRLDNQYRKGYNM